MAGNKFEKLGWNLQRFGFDLAGLKNRLLGSDRHRVLLVSLPKSGTHLVERAVCLWPQYYRALKPTIRRRNIEKYGGLETLLRKLRPGQVLVAHAPFREEYGKLVDELGIKTVFSCRDLRDVLVSFAHHVVTLKTHRLHETFKNLETPQERIRLVLEGSPEDGFQSRAETFRGYSGWLDHGCQVVRFEDLIGPRGGGSEESQAAALNALWDYLDLPKDESVRSRIAARVFSKASPTYRKGKTGGWREVFDDSLLEQFNERAGDVLARYGYENEPL